MIAGDRLPVARYRFQFRALEPIPLPTFAGYTLRGVLGNSLRQIVCSTGQPTCGGCLLQARCAYPRLFDPPRPEAQNPVPLLGNDPPSPFVLEPPPLGTERIAPGEPLSIGLVLFGQAIQELPAFVQALKLAFSEGGVGQAGLRGHAQLEDVLREEGTREISIWESRESRPLPWKSDLAVPAFPGVHRAHLTFLTPLCLKQKGSPHPSGLAGPGDIRARSLINAITRRASVLFALHAGIRDLVADPRRLAQLADTLQETHSLEPLRTKRYSASQRREIHLDGLIGDWTLQGELTDLAPWLWLGQWLHAGKSTVMGLGRYQVTFN